MTIRSGLLCFLLLCWQTPALAFYSDEGEYLNQELRGLFYAAAGLVDGKKAGNTSARLMANADMKNWHGEYHQVWQLGFTNGRSSSSHADRLNLSYSGESFYLKVGRQVVNLATTFYFSPNDFFGSFSVRSFNRDYKQGVDAIYSELQLGGLSQLSALLVNNHREKAPTSALLRLESAFENISWMAFAAEVSDPFTFRQKIIGGSIQTDILDQIGLRAEGHINQHNHKRTAEWVVGLEQRWANELNLNVEWFHHGAKAVLNNLPYSGSQYLALGLSYPFNPLLNGSFSLIHNMDDRSQLHTAYLNYSLSNESTLSAYALQPNQKSITTEFGRYVPILGLELLVYF